jgi:hypothetical protein
MARVPSATFLILSFVIGHWSLVIAASAAELRWKFSSGDEFVARIEQKSEVDSSLGGAAPTRMTMESGLELAWKVVAVDEQGAAVISQRFQRLRMKLEMPKSGVISYDSASEAKPAGDAKAIAAAMQPLLDAEIKLTISPRGEITSVEPGEAAQRIVEGLEGSNPLKTLLSKEGLSNVLRQMVVVLPEGDVQPGEKWPRVASLSTALGKFKQTTTFELLPPDAASPEVSRIESVSHLELEEPAVAKSRPAALKKQQQKGLILFDQAAGRLRSAEVEQELVTSSQLKDTPIQVKLVSSLKMTLELAK